MICAFKESSSLATDELMKRIYALRHKIFVEKLGWQAIERADKLERDQFDHSDALHMALISNGEVLAYTRLLPTLGPHLLTDVYPGLMHGRSSPRGPDIWEWTRLCAIPDPVTGQTTPIRTMMTAVAEFSVKMGFKSLIAQSDPGWITRLNRLGWDAKPLAVPTIYDGVPVVPLEARISETTVAKTQQRLRLHGPVLDLGLIDVPAVRMVA